MNLWEWIFGPPILRIDHQILGDIYSDDRGRVWHADEVQTIGCRGRPSLLIYGDKHGPFPVCVETYQQIYSGWSRIEPTISQEILQLNHNYVGENASEAIQSPELVWSSTELLGIGVEADGCFDLTYRFDWQKKSDGHEITMVFKEWEFQSYYIDG
ncbi:hypothetical protein GC163_15670 [bacterium]|nr:hypothetical protein [bacterium]